MADTHFSALQGKRKVVGLGLEALPLSPLEGDFFIDSLNNRWVVYQGGSWWFRSATTTTSTSTSTTTTSTSTSTTTTTSTSTSTTTTSTSTSTTTTL